MARFTLNGMWPSGPTYKVGLMLSLTGTPYAYNHIDLRAGAHKDPGYLEKNRFGQVPCLEDHEADICLCQSSAILEYLAEVTGQFGGASRTELYRAKEWQHWAVLGLAAGVYRARAKVLGFFDIPDPIHAVNVKMANDGLKELDKHLDGKTWLVGDGATIADIDLYGVAAYCGQAQIDLAPYPNVQAWMAQVEALPGFKDILSCLPQESVAA